MRNTAARRHTAAHLCAWLLSVIVVGVLALAGCAGPTSDQGASSSAAEPAQRWTPPSGPVASPVPTLATQLPAQFAGTDRRDPDAVAVAALTIWFTWSPDTDLGPVDAVARAAPLLTTDYAATAAGGRPINGPDAEWQRWASAGVVVTARVERGAERPPPETPEHAYRQFRMTQTPIDADHRPLPDIGSYVDVVLDQDDAGWLVSAVRQR